MPETSKISTKTTQQKQQQQLKHKIETSFPFATSKTKQQIFKLISSKKEQLYQPQKSRLNMTKLYKQLKTKYPSIQKQLVDATKYKQHIQKTRSIAKTKEKTTTEPISPMAYMMTFLQPKEMKTITKTSKGLEKMLNQQTRPTMIQTIKVKNFQDKQSLINMLPSFKSLKQLNARRLGLGGNDGWSYGDFNYFTKNILPLLKNLEKLDLAFIDTGININDFKVFVKAFASLKKLKKLDLESTLFSSKSDEKAIEIAKAIHHLQNLEELNLYVNKLTDRSINEIVKELEKLKHFKKLNVRGNYMSRSLNKQLKQYKKFKIITND